MNYLAKKEHFSDIKNRWAHIRNMYNDYYFKEFEKGEKFNAYDMFLFQWTDYMTPIEKAAWQEIRGIGGMQMFPQIPLLHYFIDFGDPYQKIGIELDGKQHDKERDRIRDQRIYDETGWLIFRIPSGEINYKIEKELSELNEKFYECDCFDEREGLKEKITELTQYKILNTDIGVIEAVKFFYSYVGRFFNENDNYLWLYQETLINHCLVNITDRDIMRSINKPNIPRLKTANKRLSIDNSIFFDELEYSEPIDGIHTLGMVEEKFDEMRFVTKFDNEINRILKIIK